MFASMGNRMRTSRRGLLQGISGIAVLSRGPAAAAPAPHSPEIYTRIGVKPLINLTATTTINGGAPVRPEVLAAMEQASRWSVNIDELMAKTGALVAEWMGAESAIITSGTCAAMTHATAACVTGGDPEKIKRLPIVSGPDEVIMPRQSRNEFDHAIRAAGVRIVEVDTPRDFEKALGERTVMIAVEGIAEAQGKVRLEQMAAAGRKRGIPTLVDAAAELPARPDPYLARGADLVAYSGGKILRGPQCAGVLAGRRDLVRAAALNCSPRHSFGRAMKVGKEEIIGMLTAMDLHFHKNNLASEYRQWEAWYSHITTVITRVPDVATRVVPPGGASPYPALEISWKSALTAGELYKLLLEGNPAIVTQAAGDGHSFLLRPVAMHPDDYKIVARRLHEIFAAAGQRKPASPDAPPGADVTGRWSVELEFVRGVARQSLDLQAGGGRVKGIYRGTHAAGEVDGTVAGNTVRFRGTLPADGVQLVYLFEGRISGDRMSGTVSLGEYGAATWKARRG